MKYALFIFSFLILIISSNSAICNNNYIINHDTVYIDDSKVYLSATPHTLSSSGWVYFNLTSKIYTGDIDVCWGFNTTVSKPIKAELYKPYWINTTTDHEKIFYNPSFVIYTGDELDYGNSYNTNYRYTVTEQIINDNGTIYITSNIAFDSFDTDGTNYTVYWHIRDNNHCLWKDFTSSFNSVIHDYNGFDKWYYIKNVPIVSNKEYTVRAWVDVPVRTKKQSGKYYFAIKPSGETISQAINNGHFYNLDPWWNATWSKRKNITLTGNTSGAQTDYQLLLNVTYDSDMQPDFDDLRFCNETHELDSWLESKVDSSYALVWAEFPTTPANGVNQTYYMYYGKADALDYWDGNATFPDFFEDFESVADWDYDSNYNALSYSFTAVDGIGDMMVNATNDGHVVRYKKDCSFNTTNMHMLLCFKGDANTQIYMTALGSERWRVAWLSSPSSYTVYDEAWNIDGAITIVKVHTKGAASGTQHNYFDYMAFRKYAASPPMYSFGSEEIYESTPPTPINLVYTTGNFWVNHTWGAGSGNVTNGYNVSVNDVWHNTTDIFYNDTYTPHAWQNITVYAFNSTGSGTLSSESVTQDTQIPNNPIIIINTSDWSGDAGETVYVDYDATDADSDVSTFSCNRTDLFTNFDTVTGKGNWTATANIYYVDFGVSDGYGSTSNYTMTLTELSVTPPSLLDELKLIMSEITSGLKSVNMGNYLVYAFILIGILLIILLIQILNNCIYRG